MASPVAVIKVAEGLIKHPSRWIKGAASKGEGGTYAATRNDAVCWCASGAIDHAAYVLNGQGDYTALDSAARYLDKAARARGYSNIVDLNDASLTTHADIVAVFEEARALAEQAENPTPIPAPSTYFGTTTSY